ncbi:MAG: hypothetical protein OXE85_06035 [Roseovarius sp.]|nr:hypothetical protein [Roseovarius sp.]
MPEEDWRRVKLANVGRKYRNPRVLETMVRISGHPGDIGQIAVLDLCHEDPTLPLTNQMKTPARQLFDRYARAW